jgi:hypothetical protein
MHPPHQLLGIARRSGTDSGTKGGRTGTSTCQTDAMVEVGDLARGGAGRAFVGRDREVGGRVGGRGGAIGVL